MSERVAIVTGGLTGIGLAIGAELARQGVHVAIGSRRGGDESVSGDARAVVGNTGCVGELDVRDTASIDAFMDKVRTLLGSPDILVNNAGTGVHHVTEGHSDEDWERVIDVNLNGPFRMIRACIGDMKKRQWGRVVNIASTAARVAAPTHGAYCASKAGLVALTRAVALEGAPHGVTCLSVSPGWVETEMLHRSAASIASRSGRTPEQEIALMASANPQGRLIQPQEVAAVAAFCCSEQAPALTMEDIQVNAGALW